LEAAKQFPWQTAVMAALEVVLLVLYVFAVRGVVRWVAPGAFLCLLLGVALYFVGISGGVIGAARFRLPVMPAVCILAAAGIKRRGARPGCAVGESEAANWCEKESGRTAPRSGPPAGSQVNPAFRGRK
jgi:hypothetical protein